MTDGNVRDVLARALPADTSASFVTPEAAIAAGRRARGRQGRRRTVALAAAGLVIAGLGAGAVVLPGWLDGWDPQAGTSIGGDTGTKGLDSGPTNPPMPMPEADLTGQLRAAVGRVLPDAVFTMPPPETPLTVTFFGDRYRAFGDVTNASASGTFAFEAWLIPELAPRKGCDGYVGLDCRVSTGPNGETIAVETGRANDDPGGVLIRVIVDRPDGTVLIAEVYHDASSPSSPITADQLLDILLSPGLAA